MKLFPRFDFQDEWFYYKFYCNPLFADEILRLKIYDFVNKLFSFGFINKFFFVRYYDPDFHIRVRFKVSSKDHFISLMGCLNSFFTPLIHSDKIWDVSISTYVREFERYNQTHYEFYESFFSFDSYLILEFLSNKKNINELDRLIFSFSIIKFYQNKLNVSDDYLINLFSSFITSNNTDISNDILSRKYISSFFRNHKSIIFSIMNTDYIYSNECFSNIFFNFDIKFNNEFSFIPKVINFQSLIHMSFNRIFITNNNNYEYFVYDLYKLGLRQRKFLK